jgi:hypothetical protein
MRKRPSKQVRLDLELLQILEPVLRKEFSPNLKFGAVLEEYLWKVAKAGQEPQPIEVTAVLRKKIKDERKYGT